jgi:hypothetical protein
LAAGQATSGQGARLGAFDGHGDIGSPKIAGSATYNAVSQEYALAAGGVQHVGPARRVPVRLEAPDGRLHPAGARRAPRQGRRSASQGRLDDPAEPGRRRAVRRRRDPRRRPDVAAVPPAKGAITEQKEMAIKGADVIQLERKGGAYIFSAAKYGDPFTVAEIADVSLGDEVLVGLALCSHNPGRDGARDLPRRPDRPAGEGHVRPLPRLHRQRARDPGRRTGHRQDHP